MSALDLDALLELSSDATAKRAEAARLLDVSTERYRENRKARTREDIATTNAAYSTAIDAFVVANKAAHEAESAMREAATDALPALITRLRAAEARPAWQPIASVPIGETVMLWTPVRRIHVGHVTTLARCEYTAWAPLPAAPEAP